jgi:hypothetical protein
MTADHNRSSTQRTCATLIAAYFVLIIASVSQAQAQSVPAAPMKIGMNSVGANYYATALMFADVNKMFYEWNNKDTPALTFDQTTGELTTGFSSLPSTKWPRSGWAQGMGGHFPAGTYDLVFDGDATFTCTGCKKVTANHYQHVAVADPVKGLVKNHFPVLGLTRNNPNNAYRNAHFYLPGHLNDKQTWLTGYLNHLKPFSSTTRPA